MELEVVVETVGGVVISLGQEGNLNGRDVSWSWETSMKLKK